MESAVPSPSPDRVNAFKEAFREHPAGIAVITAVTDAGPVGLTASSVASVGIDPTALVFSVTRATGSAGGILRAPSFVVHLLDTRHVGLVRQFSVSGGDRFTPEQGWVTLPTGEPLLLDARASLRCRPLQVTPVGPSSVVVAEVLDVRLPDLPLRPGETEGPDRQLPGQPETEPLVYFNRQFRTLGGEAV